MSQEANPYLRDAVLTASPEQLQLMLYDGAIRFTRQGIEAVEKQDWEQCFNGFNRAQRIILELLNSLNYEVDADLCKRVAGIYNFLYRKLVEACSNRDSVPARDALGILQFQRETWVMLLEKLKQERGRQAQPVAAVALPSGPAEEEAAAVGYGTLCVEG
jgi:flagellar secretion chaperone FliS